MGTDLEVLPIGDGTAASPTDERPRSARPGWPWALLAGLAVVFALAFPVRTSLAHSELDGLERVWAQMLALEDSRTSIAGRLASNAVMADAQRVEQADLALDREEHDRAATLARALPAHHSFDHGVGALHAAIAKAMRLQVDDLAAAITARARHDATPPLEQTTATATAFQRVADLLDGQRRRFGEGIRSLPGTSAALHSADSTLAALSRYADRPLGARLLVNSDFGPRVVDIDRSTNETVDLGPSAQVVFRGGFAVVSDGGRVFRLAPNLAGPPRDLGDGTVVFAAQVPDAVWIVSQGTVREVTTDGRILFGPVFSGPTVLASLDAGLLVGQESTGLAVVDLPANRVVRTVSRVFSLVVAAAGDTVVWFDRTNPALLHVTTVSSGTDRTVQTDGGHLPVASGALSPDHRRLALYLVDQASSAFVPAVVDLATMRLQLIPDAANPLPRLSMAWTADGSGLFFTTDQNGATIGSWRPGDSAATILRWRDASAFALQVLPQPG